jgi:streptogramin lyase
MGKLNLIRANKGFSQRALRSHRRPGVESLESRLLLSASITEFPALFQGANGQPTQLAFGSDGNLWFGEAVAVSTPPQTTGEIGVFSPKTNTVINQVSTGSYLANPQGLVSIPGSPGTIWFTVNAGYQLGQISTNSETVVGTYNHQYSPPASPYNAGGAITASNGNLYFVVPSANGIIEATTSLTAFNPYTVAPANIKVSGYSSQIVADPADNLLWFTEPGAIGVFSLTSNSVIAQVALPTTNGTEAPAGITIGPDGNVWFTESTSSNSAAVGVINAQTQQFVTQFALPNSSKPTGITVGPDNNVWFTETGAGAIGHVIVSSLTDPTQDSLGTAISIPTLGQTGGVVATPTPQQITIGPDNNLWFTDSSGAIGEVILNNSFSLVATTTPSGSITAGTAIGLTVTAEYASGDTDVGFTGNVTATIYNKSNVQVASQTVSVVGGVATFTTLAVNSAGTNYTVSVTSSATSPPTSIAAGSFNVVAASPVKFTIATPVPSPVTAGTSFGLVAELTDTYGNLATNYSGSVVATIDSASNSVVGTQTVPVADGEASFSGFVLDAAASGYTVTISNSVGNSPPPLTSAAFTVAPAAPAKYVVTSPISSPVVAGTPFGLTVTLEDQFNNPTTNYTASVTATIYNASNATVGTQTLTTSGGQAAFSGLVLDTAASGYTIAVTSTTAGAPPSLTTSPFAVAPAAPVAFTVTSPALTSVTAGSSFGLSAELVDAYGNIATNYSGSVVATITNASSTTVATQTLPISGGSVTFSGFVLDAAASGYAVTISNSGGSTPPALTTATFTVVPTAPVGYFLSALPSQVAGAPFGLTATLEDQYGNPTTNFTASVTATIYDKTNTSVGTQTLTTSGGQVEFSGFVLDLAASGYTIQLTSSTAGAPSSLTTSQFAILPAAPTKFVVSLAPSTTLVAGQTFGIGVSLEDQFNNLATNYTGTVSVAIASNPGGSSLSGVTSKSVSPSGSTPGIASFSGLWLNKAGTNYSLQVTASGGVKTTFSGIAVSPAAPAKIVVITAPPTTVNPGQLFNLQAVVTDAYGNVTTNYNGTVTVSVANNPGGSVLGGTTAANVSSTSANPGYVSFAGLSLNNAGSGYSLVLAGTGLSATTAVSLNVLAPPQPPVVVSASVVTKQKVNAKGRKIGKPVIAGYVITFNTTMNGSSLASTGSYVMDTVVLTKRTKKRPSQTVLTPIGFQVTQSTSNSVTIAPIGNPFAKKAGMITLNAGGVASSLGASLASNVNLSVAKGGKSIVVV